MVVSCPGLFFESTMCCSTVDSGIACMAAELEKKVNKKDKITQNKHWCTEKYNRQMQIDLRFHNDRNRNVEQSHWQADCEKTKKNEKIPIKKLTVKRRATAGAWELRKENSTENKLQRTHFFLLIFRCTVRAAGKVSIYCHSTIAHEKVIVCSLLELRQPAGEGIPL